MNKDVSFLIISTEFNPQRCSPAQLASPGATEVYEVSLIGFSKHWIDPLISCVSSVSTMQAKKKAQGSQILRLNKVSRHDPAAFTNLSGLL